MQNVEAQTLTGIEVSSIIKFLGFAGVATLLPFYIHIQWVTGPIINAILVLTLFLVGIRSAMVVALVPSLMAMAGGLLPAILAPMVPFIMIGNVIFVLSIDWIYNNTRNDLRGYWIGVIVGAAIKFSFLFFSVNIIGKLLIKQELTIKVAQILSWPQFATAVTGGMIAWIVLKWLKRF